MWYELELADSYRRQNKLNMALKYYGIQFLLILIWYFHFWSDVLVLVIKHFSEIQDDQMDFHSYALRKVIFCHFFLLNSFYQSLDDCSSLFVNAKNGGSN